MRLLRALCPLAVFGLLCLPSILDAQVINEIRVDQPGADNYQDVILRLPTQSTPGSVWSYASAPVDLLSLAVANATGKTVRDMFNQQIGARIGIPAIAWGSFGANTGASSKASISAREVGLQEQGHAQFRLQRCDLPAHPRLLDVQLHGGARESEMRCGSLEGRDLVEGDHLAPHDHSPTE